MSWKSECARLWYHQSCAEKQTIPSRCFVIGRAHPDSTGGPRPGSAPSPVVGRPQTVACGGSGAMISAGVARRRTAQDPGSGLGPARRGAREVPHDERRRDGDRSHRMVRAPRSAHPVAAHQGLSPRAHGLLVDEPDRAGASGRTRCGSRAPPPAGRSPPPPRRGRAPPPTARRFGYTLAHREESPGRPAQQAPRRHTDGRRGPSPPAGRAVPRAVPRAAPRHHVDATVGARRRESCRVPLWSRSWGR